MLKRNSFFSKQGIFLKMKFQKQKDRTTINFQKIQVFFLCLDCIFSLKKSSNRLQLVQIIFLSQRKKMCFACHSRKKAPFSFNKTTQPRRKIRKGVYSLRSQFKDNFFLVFIFQITCLKIFLNTAIIQKVFLKKHQLKSQPACLGRIFFENFKNFFHFFFIIFNPKYKFTTSFCSDIPDLKVFFQNPKHFRISWCIFKFNNKSKLENFRTPMIHLNTSITIYQSNKKSFVKRIVFSHFFSKRNSLF